MSEKFPHKQPIALLKASFNLLFTQPVLLFPFAVLALVEFLALEILFFSPRYPLNIFFGPMIRRLEGPVYLHYPFNFVVVVKWYQSLQMPFYILFGVLAIAVAVQTLNYINSDKKVRMKVIFRQAFSSYVHLLVAGLIWVALLIGLSWGYGFLVKRALQIRSTAGIYHLIKMAVLLGEPYIKFLFEILTTTVFAFVVPSIVIGKKKIFAALGQNFKILAGSFWYVFLLSFVPSLLYLPILVIRVNSHFVDVSSIPELWLVVMVVGTVVALFIDAFQYTAITTYYLYKKESA